MRQLAGVDSLDRRAERVVEGNNMANGFTGPSLEGLVFIVKSTTSGKPNHTLTITVQQPLDSSIAFVAGTWQGEGPNPKNFAGSITAAPSLITCSWPNGMMGANGKTGMNALVCNVVPASRIPGNPTGRWHLDGSVVVTDGQGNVVPGAGPGTVSGDEPPPVLHQ